MNGSNGSTLLIASACAVSISLAFQFYTNFRTQPVRKAVDETQYKLYLDQMWLRINRAWGIPERKLNGKHMKLTFELDKLGKASGISIEGAKSGTELLDQRLLSTIEAASPFPAMISNAPEHVQVRCDLEVKDGELSLALKIPEIESSSGITKTVVENVSEQEKIRSLSNTMSGNNRAAKQEALEELKNLATPSPAAIDALNLALKDKDDEVRYEAFETVQALGPDAIGTLPTLLKIVNGSNESARVNAVEAVGSLGPAAKAAIPSLLATLHEKGSTFHMSLHEAATNALRKIDPSTNKAALAILLPSMDESDFFTWEVDTFAGFGQDAMPALLNAVNKVENRTRFINAAKALGKMGDIAVPAVPALAAACRSRDEDVAENAAEAIQYIGPKAKAAVPDLIYALEHPAIDSRYKFLDALAAIGKAATPALPALREVAKSDPSNKDRANDAIRNITHAEE